jgi:hypothetical protein
MPFTITAESESLLPQLLGRFPRAYTCIAELDESPVNCQAVQWASFPLNAGHDRLSDGEDFIIFRIGNSVDLIEADFIFWEILIEREKFPYSMKHCWKLPDKELPDYALIPSIASNSPIIRIDILELDTAAPSDVFDFGIHLLHQDGAQTSIYTDPNEVICPYLRLGCGNDRLDLRGYKPRVRKSFQ